MMKPVVTGQCFKTTKCLNDHNQMAANIDFDIHYYKVVFVYGTQGENEKREIERRRKEKEEMKKRAFENTVWYANIFIYTESKT